MSPSEPTLVNIGTHSLALYNHGPEPSKDEDPVILFVSGVASSRYVWAAAVRQLPPHIRSYTYDRSGYGKSEVSALAPTAENLALELSLLIDNAPINHPLILVGHSWAGVLINEFLARQDTVRRVAGLVLVDANYETQPLVLNVMDPVLAELFAGIDQYRGKGIEAEHKLTKEEWERFRRDEDTESHQAAAERELSEYGPSFETLRRKNLSARQPLLGDKPVYVIGGRRSKDWTGMYNVAVELGQGTEEQRAYVREMIRTADEKAEGLMKRFLELSTRSTSVIACESGHFVQLTQPDTVVDGVQWVLAAMQAAS